MGAPPVGQGLRPRASQSVPTGLLSASTQRAGLSGGFSPALLLEHLQASADPLSPSGASAG